MTTLIKIKEEISKLRAAIESQSPAETLKENYRQILEVAEKFQINLEQGFSEDRDFPREFSLQLDKVRFVQRKLFQNLNLELNYEQIEKICSELEESYETLAEIAGIF